MNAEDRIRGAINLLIGGPVPAGRKCDITSLCAVADVPRATLYRTYPHLKAEFERRRGLLHDAGIEPDPRQEQINRLKREVEKLRERLATRERDIADHENFRRLALSRLAAQHEEILQLRTTTGAARSVNRIH